MIDIQQIYLMLGNECNLQCKYCIQHPIVNDTTPHGVNQKVINYIENILEHQKSPLKVTFYGGEPLIFWNDIKEYIKKIKKVNFNLITNGKLLTQDKINFINNNKISVGISYDGENSLQTRGYDVLKEKKDLLVQIKRLCMTGVITKYNYPQDWFESLNKFNNEYIKLHRHNISVNLDLLLNNDDLHGLSDFDFDKLSFQMKNLCDHFLNVQINKNDIQLNDFYIEKLLDRCRLPYKNNFSKCRNGINNLNIDTDGNMYLCHNTHIKVGTIKDDFLDVLKKVFELDKTCEKHFCDSCEVRFLCQKGCMLQNKETLNDYFCELAKSFYQPILDLKKNFYY